MAPNKVITKLERETLLKKYFDKTGRYNPYVSEKVRQDYKNSRDKKVEVDDRPLLVRIFSRPATLSFGHL
jgi:hypothetical protein